LQLWVKQPGHENELLELPLRVAYEHHFAQLPDAYERVLADAMLSNRALFTTSEETIAAWRILEPIQKAWSTSDEGLFFYKKGEDPQEMAKTYHAPLTHTETHTHHHPPLFARA
jgi:glucose-6-phosphate 1-dehydrogenase